MLPRLILWACAIVLVTPSIAYAYLDAGTGTMLLQGLVAALAGLAVVVRLYWRKIKRLFKKGEPAQAETLERSVTAAAAETPELDEKAS